MLKNRISKAAAILLIAVVTALLAVSLSGCNTKTGNYVESETIFSINTLSLLGDDYSYGLNTDKSTITLRPDGSCTIILKPQSQLILMANIYLATMEIPNSQIEGFVDDYGAVLPGFDLSNVEESLKLLYNTVGLTINGLTSENENVKAMFEQIESGNGLKSPKLPSNISIEFNTVYTIEQLHSDYTGDYTAVYVGEYDAEQTQEPFFIFTLTDVDGTQSLSCRWEMLNLTLKASVNKPEAE